MTLSFLDLETVKDWYKSVDNGKWDKNDFILDNCVYQFNDQVWKGKDAVLDYMTKMYTSGVKKVEHIHQEVFIGGHDKVVACGQVKMEKDDGTNVSLYMCTIWHMRDKKCHNIWNYGDTSAWLLDK